MPPPTRGGGGRARRGCGASRRPAGAARVRLGGRRARRRVTHRLVDLVHEGKLDEAEQAARDLLVRYPDVHHGFERLAMVYEARGDRAHAAEYYRKALAFMLENADNHDAEGIDWMRTKAESMEQNP